MPVVAMQNERGAVRKFRFSEPARSCYAARLVTLCAADMKPRNGSDSCRMDEEPLRSTSQLVNVSGRVQPLMSSLPFVLLPGVFALLY